MKFAKFVVAVIVSGALAACAAPPSKEQAAEILKPVLPAGFSVTSVTRLREIAGVYEVVVAIDNQPTLLYLDSSLKYIISGTVVEIATKRNLTYESQVKVRRAEQPLPAVPITTR